ncbi:MAG: SMC-Scp complex subunit ScpB [Planctomycetes bacterium]|nr:SMC-Scp complex subunit ScpB [Planctomycetota bacterium]
MSEQRGAATTNVKEPKTAGRASQSPREEPVENGETATPAAGPERGDAPEPPLPDLPLKPAVEALLFVSREPLAARRLAELTERAVSEVKEALRALAAEYDATGRAFSLVEIAGGWQLLTRADYHPFVSRLQRVQKEAKLTPAGLQTLAIIAYKAPITRAEIDVIRGANSSLHVRQLLDKGFVKIVGRKAVPGSPLQYGPTRLFLDHFGLKSLKDLPQKAEFRPPPEGADNDDADGDADALSAADPEAVVEAEAELAGDLAAAAAAAGEASGGGARGKPIVVDERKATRVATEPAPAGSAGQDAGAESDDDFDVDHIDVPDAVDDGKA